MELTKRPRRPAGHRHHPPAVPGDPDLPGQPDLPPVRGRDLVRPASHPLPAGAVPLRPGRPAPGGGGVPPGRGEQLPALRPAQRERPPGLLRLGGERGDPAGHPADQTARSRLLRGHRRVPVRVHRPRPLRGPAGPGGGQRPHPGAPRQNRPVPTPRQAPTWWPPRT